MGRKKSGGGEHRAPEFHIVARRPHSKGPLAPYRFLITIGFALAVAGSALWNAAQTGVGVDPALIRFGVSALFAWIVVGHVSSILGSAERPTPRSSPIERIDPGDQQLVEQP